MLLRSLWFVLGLAFCFGCAPTAPAASVPPPSVAQAKIAKKPLSYAVPDALVPIGKRDPILGNPDAPITIVVFSDYQCPFCARVQPTLSEVKERYPNTVRWVIKNLPLPFHEHAHDAAAMAQAVYERLGTSAFERYSAKLYTENQNLSPENLKAWAEELGMAQQEAEAAQNAPEYGAKVVGDAAVAEHVGLSGTPAFLINGRRLVGAQPLSAFSEIIDRELAEIGALPKPLGDANAIYRARTQKNLDAEAKADAAKVLPEDEDPGPDLTVYRVPIDGSPVEGPATAPVTLVMFTDFQCPFCARAEQTLAEVKKQYGDDLRVVFKHTPLPFHQEATPAARFAARVFVTQGNEKFWQVAHRLFEKQTELGEERYAAIAKELGLPGSVLKDAKQRASAELDRLLLKDQMLAADLEVEGTPQFFINGRRLMGAQPAASFVAIIDERLAEAKALIAKGVKAEALYEEVLKTAQVASAPEPKRVKLAPTKAARPARGSPRAKVTIDIFSDFQCPFCERVRGTLQALEKLHPGQIRIVWRNLPLPFHPDAPLAAEAALEAFAQRGDVGFWKMEELLFQDRTKLGRAHLEEYAAKLGLNIKRFQQALDDRRHRAVIYEDSDAAEALNIRGTPTSVVNGYVVGGAQSLAAFEKVVQLALAEPSMK
ncbi:MAG: thioredoxin domain-containing protein [Polyangiaceae bacterium]|nr:thioredoxin domain-containing protein [Polyangiaceae bacterium]